jgi:hypothetical protein
MLLVLAPVKDAGLDQLAQPNGQDVAAGPGVLGELIKPVHAKENLAERKQTPALPDDR